MPEYIHIAEPCHEDWNNMSPNEQGRHCAQCCKTVVDFTNWETNEIVYYLKANAEKGVCGRFNEQQMNTPIPTPEEFVTHIRYMPLTEIKRVAAIFLFVFGILAASCNTGDTTGKAIDDTAGQVVIKDTTPQLLGKPATVIDTTPVRELMGDTVVCSKPDTVVAPKNDRRSIKGEVTLEQIQREDSAKVFHVPKAVPTLHTTMGIVATLPDTTRSSQKIKRH